jgi:hypothetical protein
MTDAQWTEFAPLKRIHTTELDEALKGASLFPKMGRLETLQASALKLRCPYQNNCNILERK